MTLDPLASLYRLPSDLPPGGWWRYAPLVDGVLAAGCPQRVGLLAEADPAAHPALEEALGELAPEAVLLGLTSDEQPEESLDLLIVHQFRLVPQAEELAAMVPIWQRRLRPGGWLLLTDVPAAAVPSTLGIPARHLSVGKGALVLSEAESKLQRVAVLATKLESRGLQLQRLAESLSRREIRERQEGELNLRQRHRDLEQQFQLTLTKLNALETSTVWRATQPLRRLLDRQGSLRRLLGSNSGVRREVGQRLQGVELLPQLTELLSQRIGGKPVLPGLPCVLVVSHEASATGAPILAWNLCRELAGRANVVVLLLESGGSLEREFLEQSCLLLGPPKQEQPSSDQIAACLQRLPSELQPGFALVNTIQAWRWPELLRRCGIPCLCLIHEFASYIRPPHALIKAALWSDRLVFSTEVTWSDARSRLPLLEAVKVEILPQGRCQLPWNMQETDQEGIGLEHLGPLRKAGYDRERLQSCRVVLGAGAVQPRKGLDLFVSCAHHLLVAEPILDVLFVWLGSGYKPYDDFTTSVWVEDQIQRWNLEDRVFIVDCPEAYEAALRRADAFLLPSRLDPLPNVAIDALSEAVPLIAFERASGTAAWLGKDPLLATHCLAAYLEPASMADQLLRLLQDDALHKRLGAHGQALARRDFNMKHYANKLLLLGEAASKQVMQENEDLALICEGEWIDTDFCRPREGDTLADLPLTYLMSWRNGVYPYKPFPGFHPGIYREHCLPPGETTDPLAHYIRAGRPKGRWLTPLITPSSQETLSLPTGSTTDTGGKDITVGLHIHIFYLDLLAEILERMAANRLRPRLYLSMASNIPSQSVETLAEIHGFSDVSLHVTPNRGRDLGPLLMGLGRQIEAECEVYGHIHTKKSELISAGQANQWRNFLLGNLLSHADTAMADRVIAALISTPRLGLVFASDPNSLGWGENLGIAESLCGVLNLPKTLPKAIEFPVGSMFWARRGALSTLYEHPWNWSDFPEEPVGYDGTVLHAVERLMPHICEASGFHYRLTHVPGVSR